MGIDAAALLRIANLPAPATPYGPYLVEHRGDATLLHTFNRFDAADPDEHALALRHLLGDALDAHDDPRGILIFADICEPKRSSYDAIVSELLALGGGAWAPKVDADYVPVRYRGKPRRPHDAIVGELIAVMGRDAALQLDTFAQVDKLMLMDSPDRRDAVEGYQAKLDAVTKSVGAEVAQRYEASLQAEVEATIAKRNRPPILLVDTEVDDAIIVDQKGPPIALLDILGVDVVNELIPTYDADRPADGHRALVAEMVKVMGREAAFKHNVMAWEGRIAVSTRSPDDPDATSKYRAPIEAITRAMGAEFTERYEASLKRIVDALLADSDPLISAFGLDVRRG